MILLRLLGLFFLALSTVQAASKAELQAVLDQLHVAKGFKISIFADNVPNARTLALGDNGVIYIGTRQQGAVYALQDTDQDGVADKRFVIAENLYMPNGVAYKDGTLYVAETHRIIRFDQIGSQLEHPPAAKVVFDRLPSDRHHGWKYLRFGPDNKLYTAVGAPCNICQPEKPIYGSLVRLNTDGSEFEIIAQGIRNTVGFDWTPDGHSLFFTENGRDYMGDDLPPDELNQWSEKDEHFGYPYCHGGNIPEAKFTTTNQCDKYKAPAWRFKAHMAPLGIRFYQGKQFPARFHNQLFVAQHGSWNRSKPHGYRVVVINFKNGKPVSEQSFIDGWLTKQGEVLGRPTDILQLPNGSLLIADDTLGVIYNVEYQD